MNQPTKVVTGKVRLTFPHLFKPYSNQVGQEPKYSTTMLLPKTDVATKAAIDAAINAAIEFGIHSKWNGARPAKISLSIHDGDGVRPNGEAFGEECQGHWVFTASSKLAPEVVMLPNLERIINESEIYSGMYALVSLNFFPYAAGGNKGVGIGLNNVAKVSDGEPLGGRTSAANDFGEVGQMSQVAQANATQPPQQNPGAWYAQQSVQQPSQQAYAQAQSYTPSVVQAQQVIDPITGHPLGGVYGI